MAIRSNIRQADIAFSANPNGADLKYEMQFENSDTKIPKERDSK